MLRICIAPLMLLVAVACKKKERTEGDKAPRAFYYWQTSLQNFPWQDSVYKSLKPDKVYLRFFDVDWLKLCMTHTSVQEIICS